MREAADTLARLPAPGQEARGRRSASPSATMPTFAAELIDKGEGGEAVLRFDRGGAALDAALDRHGVMPLPPYIAHRRAEEAADAADYQTMFAAERGAVAAPTAGPAFHAGAARRRSRRAASRSSASRCMSAPAPSCPSRPRIPTTTACMPNGAGCRPTVAARARTPPARAAAASSRSAPPRCASWKAPRTRTGAFGPSRARPRSSSRPATGSGPSMS